MILDFSTEINGIETLLKVWKSVHKCSILVIFLIFSKVDALVKHTFDIKKIDTEDLQNYVLLTINKSWEFVDTERINLEEF